MCGCGNCCYFESFFITVYYIPRKPGTRPGDFFLCPKKKKLAPATQSTEHLKFQFSGDRALGAYNDKAHLSGPYSAVPVTNTPRYTTERMHHARPVVMHFIQVRTTDSQIE